MNNNREPYISAVPSREIYCFPEQDPYGGVDEHGVFIADSLIQEAIESIQNEKADVSSLSKADVLGMVDKYARSLLKKARRKDILSAEDFSDVLMFRIKKLEEVIFWSFGMNEKNED